MNKKRIIISLMIALFFIIPSSAIIADPGNRDAKDFTDIPRGDHTDKTPMVDIVGKIDYSTNPVILQDTTTEVMGFYLEECSNNRMYEMEQGKIIPLKDCYEPKFQLMTSADISFFEPELDIYFMYPGIEYCIYETSFEDNAANYLEWGQIDMDCGSAGGYYDGWSWTDARACGSDHSFKCSMYDEYKNQQQDILYLKKLIDLTSDTYELSDGSIIDLEYVDKVKISFDLFVDGEYTTWYYDLLGDEIYTPLDYLQFGYIDGGLDPSTNFEAIEFTQQFVGSLGTVIDQDFPVPSGGPTFGIGDFAPDDFIFMSTAIPLFDIDSPAGVYKDYTNKASKIDTCPEWWHVWAEIDIGDLYDPTSFGIWFEWISDKERTYEGAYVDNIEIALIETLGINVYQGHSQSWSETDEGVSWFEFPLDWDTYIIPTVDYVNGIDENNAFYKAVCKIKNDTGGYNDWFEIDFEIGPYVDCAITDLEIEDDFSHEPIPDGGIMQYPSDAHIKFCYENKGNEPQDNIIVKATGYKLEKETLLYDDFEGVNNWVYFYDDYPLYISDDKAWSGSKSLAMNDPETIHIRTANAPNRYLGYSQTVVDMKDVTEATIDWYYQAVLPDGANCKLMLLTYKYVVRIGNTFIDNTDTPLCQKTWVGPMQPQGTYQSLDFKALFDMLVSFGYFQDDNGHDTYETGIGFALDTINVADGELTPIGCFDTGEQSWSGVYIDDISINANVVGEKVWEDTMVIPGPCEPGEICCDQFTWEDVPYSNYRIVVETFCDGDIHQDFPDVDSNNWMSSDILVLENLEQASKVEGVDYTECEPEAWCISNVVGNDCGNDSEGDHYALATNCDTPLIPEGVQDTVGLQMVDVRHLTFAGSSGDTGVPFEQPMIDDVEGDGHGAFSSDYYPYRVYDNFDIGAEVTVDKITFHGLEAYGDDSWDGEPFNIGFFADAGGSPGAVISDQVWWATSADQSFVQTWLGYSIWLVEAMLPTPVTVEDGWFSVQSAQMGQGAGYADLAWIDGVGDGNAYQDATNLNYDMAFTLEVTALGAKGPECEIIFDDGFEATPFDANWDYNTGWLDSYYGDPCEGVQHAYSWAYGDAIGKTLTFGDYETTLWFQKAAESSTHPMDLEVYCDATLVYSSYGYTHLDCQTVEVDLTAFSDGGAHTIEFVGLTSDFYGQILDDVVVETCNWVEEPEPEGDAIWLNMTYQVDIDDEFGEIVLEVAGFESVDGEHCSGCEEDDVCPAGVKAWSTVAVLGGNAPGVCQYLSVDLAEKLPAETEYMCLRFRLDTTNAINAPWYLPGIGLHIHDLSISNILYDEILGVSDFYEDWEDANFVNEESGLVWVIDCVTFGSHVTQCDDFKFCIADECPVASPYAPSSNVYTLHGSDSWGDGWDSDYDYVMDAFVDVFVNGVQVIADFTCPSGSASDTFTAEPGDEITVVYTTANGIFESEHDWYIEDADGIVWFEYMIGTQSLVLPTETIAMDGRFPAEPIDEAIVWSTEIMDAYEAYLTGNWEYKLPSECTLTFELSADGGNSWFIIALVEGPAEAMHGAIPSTPFDLTPWAGSSLLIRVHVVSEGKGEGYVCVDHLAIAGKQDMLPPTATISLDGNLISPGLYAGPVTVTINAKDDMAMGEIHYILDGSESVVSGSKATFKVSTDGDHTVEFWAVDATGNEGAYGTVSFSIDNTPPTVAITAPEPGLYLFGSKLLSMSKPIIIGAFTAEATASDGQGIAVVKFMLDGEVVGEDTTVPYSTYVAVKHMGAGTLKVIAEDGVGNTAEDTLDITYFKFL